MTKQNFKKIIYPIIEIIFLSSSFIYLNYVFNTYQIDNLSYDFNKRLFTVVILAMLVVFFAFGPFLNKIFVPIYNAIVTLYLVGESIYFTAFNQYIRLKTAFGLTYEAQGAAGSIMEFIKFEHVLPFILLIVFMIVFIVLYFLFQFKTYKFYIKIPEYIIKLVIAVFIFSQIKPVLFTLEEDIASLNNEMGAFKYEDDYYVYDIVPDSKQFVDKFGLLTFAYRDLSEIFNSKPISQNDIDEAVNFLNSRQTHNDNKYTNVFKGKNVLFIQAESFMDIAIDKELTPTLYKIKQNSIEVDGFTNPLLPNSTSDCEFMTYTSMIPNSDEEAVCYKYVDNEYKTTLAQSFKNAGYYTTLNHQMYGVYYNRSNTYKTFDFDTFMSGYKLTGENDRQKDSLVGETMAWNSFGWGDLKLDYWITFSGHQEYTQLAVGVDEDDYQKVRDKFQGIPENIASYIAKHMDLDKAIEDYINAYLEYNHSLDDLVIVFFGDHVAKGIDVYSNPDLWKVVKSDLTSKDFETKLYIYNTTIEPEVYSKPSFAIDILPTMANMFGLEIDNNSIMGHDIFDENYRGFGLTDDGLYKTLDFTYSIDLAKFIDLNISEEEARKQLEDLMDIKKYSKIIIKTNYWKGK